MKLIFKNITERVLQVYIEPSTDIIILNPGDVLELTPKFENYVNFETHIDECEVTIWIPSGQSAVLSINGEKIDSLCEDLIW